MYDVGTRALEFFVHFRVQTELRFVQLRVDRERIVLVKVRFCVYVRNTSVVRRLAALFVEKIVDRNEAEEGEKNKKERSARERKREGERGGEGGERTRTVGDLVVREQRVCVRFVRQATTAGLGAIYTRSHSTP